MSGSAVRGRSRASDRRKLGERARTEVRREGREVPPTPVGVANGLQHGVVGCGHSGNDSLC